MNILLLGGGVLLLNIAKELIEKKSVYKVNIVTSLRHAKENLSSGDSLLSEYKKIEDSLSTSNKKLSFNIISNLEESVYKELAKESDIAISFGSAWIFESKHIKYCKNLINLHCTTLPQWRGGGGPSWMILSGINYSAITIHKVDEGIDTGDIIYSKKFFFPAECKRPEQYQDYVNHLSFIYLKDFLEDFIKNKRILKTYTQQEIFSSYFPRLNSEIHACIDWTWSSSDLVRFIDAFDDPYPGAFSRIAGKSGIFYLKKAYLVEGECNYHPFQAGIIFRKGEGGLYVCSNKGAIFINAVFDSNKNNIIDNLSIGDRFYSSYDDLEKARATKTIYSSKGLINRSDQK